MVQEVKPTMSVQSLTLPILSLFGGVLFLVFGLILAGTIISQAVTAGTTTGIGSFSGAQNLNNLVPFLYYTIVIVGGLSAIGFGGYGVYSRVRGR